MLLVLGLVVLAVALVVGIRLLLAGHQLDRATPEGAAGVPVAPQGSVAAKIDARLQRTRTAVETLVMVDGVEEDDVEPSAGAFRDRAQTYGVLGACLVGLAVVVAIGVLLLL